ncbi:MAG: chemotaxis protein CheA [Oscillospiraceae bacterium]|nr:chemotaxis protein CheA [Oscillospiraceae bacterium]
MSDMGISNDQMLEMFLFEMSSLVEHLDEILLNSEKSGSLTEDDINEVFRIMHTVKGAAAMMEFDPIAAVTHRLEDSFFIIRDNGINPDHFTELFDLMLDATDFLKSQFEAIQNAQPLTENAELVTRSTNFYNMLSGKGAAPPAPPAPAAPDAPAASDTAAEPVPASPEDAAVSAGEDEHEPTYHIDVTFEDDCGMENLRSLMLVYSLQSVCNIVSYEPDDIETNPDSAEYIIHHGFSMYAQSSLDTETLQKVVEESMHVKSAHVEICGEGDSDGAVVFAGISYRYQAHVRFEEDCGMENLRSFMLVNSLRQSSNVISFDPADIESNPGTADYIMDNGFIIELESDLAASDMQNLISGMMHVKTVKLKELGAVSAPPAPAQAVSAAPDAAGKVEAGGGVPAAAPPPKPAAKPAPKAATAKPVPQNLINVNLSKLDALMDLMGELVITESMVTRSPDLKNIAHLDDFNKSARQLRKLTDELQDMVMSIRMVPVASTFHKMPRIVRDMCKALGKDADLIMMGEDTDIDKTIIDGISDPIMHLVRNSMDHGVELPDDREAAGKMRRATVTLSAQNTGGEILITVSDDGKGLDHEYLLEKAAAKGMLTKPASEYTEKEAFQILMAPGFSTKEQVTEFSGRGVGMDVVKKNIEKIGGAVVIESKKGRGTSVFLKIPLTLAIVDGMDVSVGNGIYTLQTTSINESFKAKQDQLIVDTDGKEMIMIRGNVYPIVRLHELYNVYNALTDIEQGILIWVQAGDGRSACLFVDELIGEQQIVVKPLPKYLSRFDIKPYGISGCTILGDGNISLILDVGSIIDNVVEKR